MAKRSSGMLSSTMSTPARPSLRPPGRNQTGLPSERSGLNTPHDCGPSDIPVTFTEDVGRQRGKFAQPAKMSSPLGPATGRPGDVRKTR